MIARRAPRRRRAPGMSQGRSLAWAGGVLLLLGVSLWVAVTAFNGVPLKHYTIAHVDVPEAGSLLAHDQVKMSGVRIGQLRETKIATNGQVDLTLQLEPGVRVPADSRVVVRANGLLGARFLQVVPGRSSAALGDGGRLQAAASSYTFGVPEALDTFDARTRGALGVTLRALGAGVAGHGSQLNETIREGAAQIVPFERLADTLRSRPGSLEALVPSAESATQPLNAARRQYGALLDPLAHVADDFGQEHTAVQATLEAAPPALSAATSGLGRSRRLLRAVRSFSTEATATLAPAPAALGATTALLRSAPGPLHQATGLLDVVRPSTTSALRITDALSPVLPPLRQAFTRLTPVANGLAPHGCDIENFGTTMRSMTGYAARADAGTAGEQSIFRLQLVAPLVSEVTGGKNPENVDRRDPYPAPCRFGPSTYATALDPLAQGTGR